METGHVRQSGPHPKLRVEFGRLSRGLRPRRGDPEEAAKLLWGTRVWRRKPGRSKSLYFSYFLQARSRMPRPPFAAQRTRGRLKEVVDTGRDCRRVSILRSSASWCS